MTDRPDSGAHEAAETPTPDAKLPDGDMPVVDAELAALVRRDPPPADAASEAGVDATDPAVDVTSAGADATSPYPDAPAPADAPPPPQPGVDAVPVVPVAAAVTEDAPAPPRRRRSLALRFGAAFVLGILLAVAIGTGALYAWGQQYDGRVLPGVRIGSTDLSGLTREQAQAAIEDAYGSSLATGQITLTGPDGQTTTITYADVGRGPDTSAVLDAALAAGRQGEPLADLVGAAQAAVHGLTVEPTVAYDHDKLVAAVDALATTIDETPSDASASAGQDGTFVVSPAKDGRAVDKAALESSLDEQLSSLGTPASVTMDVPVVSLQPAVSTASAEAARAAAERMAGDVVLARGEDTWTIDGASLAPLVSFSTAADGRITPVFDETGLDPILKKLAKKVKQDARDAGLKLVNGHVVVKGTSREGRTLKVAETKAAILSQIEARQTQMATQPIEAAMKVVEPKLTTKDANAFAPKMRMISKYSVYYWVIINNHWGGNIEGPATVINGTVVPAGAKFDFWKVVGDLHDAPGTGPGNAIEGGKITVTGAFGGGICTTSTTLFNAAFRAGMIPLARQNHNEFIDRYPPGLDATVWIVGNTKQTMSFRNDTAYPILITRTVTGNSSKRWLTFKIWSVPNHRKATVTNTVIQPGERAVHKTIKDPTKPVGYVFYNNGAVNGAKVWTTVTIYDHGKVHWKKRYFSNYPAVDGVTIVGTKKT
jgi:vancomycin resistance protein YoaR